MKSAISLGAVCAVGALALAACGTPSPSGAAKAAPVNKGTVSAGGAKAAPFHLVTGAADGQQHASVSKAARVSVPDGSISRVVLVSAAGDRIPGHTSAGGRQWQPDAPLAYGTLYRLTVQAVDRGNGAHEKTVSFTTVKRNERLIGTFTPEDGSTVGVGMPVSLTFNKPVLDKKAVEAAVRVTDDSGQEVIGHWFGDQRLDLRPETYWKAHTHVSLTLELDGVKGGEHAFGVQEKTVRFTVGRRQVSTVDAASEHMNVVRDGRLLRTVPISAGAPGRTTYNGQMVISEKLVQTRMDGSTVGFAGEYDIPDVPHAMRLSTSGTFLHGNYWSDDSVFGHTDTSHGCVGLNDVRGGGDSHQDAAWFFDNSLVGDVVIVKNSHDKTIAPDNGLNGWNMNWQQWKGGSALA